MKRILAGAFAALLSISAFATQYPLSLMSSAGSTSGQVPVSSGPTTPPAWGNISISTLTGILPIANGGTGQATQAAALTALLGSSVVPVANGGTNAAAASGTALDNITGFSGTGFLTRTGGGSYAFQSATNGITLGNLVQVAANTLLGNASGSTANVSAIPVTGCNGAAQALQWTNGSGFGCNSSVATSGANSNITSLSGLTALSVTDGSNTNSTVTVTNTGANGGNIKLVGNGGTTPNKYLRANTGAFQILNSAYAASILTLDDVGDLTVAGSVTPSQTGGIIGTTTNNNATAGSVGEFPTPTNLSAVALTSNASANCASVSLTPGDWEVTGMVEIAAAGSTLITNSFGGVSTTSATLGALGTYWQIANNFSAGALIAMPVPVTRVPLTTTTTVYLVANAGFTTSTATASCTMHVRRPR